MTLPKFGCEDLGKYNLLMMGTATEEEIVEVITNQTRRCLWSSTIGPQATMEAIRCW
jgi:hypothetical protein